MMDKQKIIEFGENHFFGDCYLKWEQMKEYIATLPSSQWISVEDRLPEEDGIYLVVLAHDRGHCIHQDVISFEWLNRNWLGILEELITHWQPLAAPPEDS